jgi:hypothetical protein
VGMENTIPASSDSLERERWLDAIVPLAEGAQLASISVDTLKREAKRGRYQLISVSARRKGIRRRNALQLPAPNYSLANEGTARPTRRARTMTSD